MLRLTGILLCGYLFGNIAPIIPVLLTGECTTRLFP